MGRGSENFVLNAARLDALFEVLNADANVQLENWWVRGQPAPDSFQGTLVVKSAAGVPGVLKTVLDQVPEVGITAIHLFPYGIPAIDTYEVVVSAVSGVD